MIGILKERKYPSDPVKVWKKRITDGEEEESEEVDKEASEDEKSDYNYLLGMPMWNMSQEKKNELLKDRDKKVPSHFLCYFTMTTNCVVRFKNWRV